MIPKIRIRLIAAMAVCAGLLNVSGALAKTVSVAVSKSFFGLPAMIAESEGLFEHPTIKVRLEPCFGGVRCMQMLNEGRVQFATAGDMPITMSSFRPNAPTILAAFANSATNTKLLASEASGVLAISDLKGKRVGLVAYSNAHYQHDVALLFARGDPKSVMLTDVEPAKTADLLKQGSVDAAFLWEPYASQALASVPGLRHIKMSRLYVESFYLTSDAQSARSEEAVVVLRGLIRAVELIRNQPKRAAILAAKYLKVTEDVAGALLPTYQYEVGLAQAMITTLEAQARWVMGHKQVPEGSRLPNFLTQVNAHPLRTINPALVMLVQ